MRRRSRLLMLLLAAMPDGVRHRVFEAAYADLRAEREERLAEVSGWRGWWVRAFAPFQTFHLVAACYVFTLTQALRRARSAPRDARSRGSALPLGQEVRQSLRLFRKDPGFTLVAILTLAIAIGGNTAIFSVVDAVLLRPLPFPEQDRLVDVGETMNGVPTAVSPVNFVDWKASTHVFERMALYTDAETTISGAGSSPQKLTACLASAAMFRTLGVSPAIGRNFISSEDFDGEPKVAILSDRLWKTRFGSNPRIVGTDVRFDSEPYKVVGVMPPGISFPEGTDVWFPLALTPRQTAASARGAHYMNVVARLKDGTSIRGASAEMSRIAARLAHDYPRTNQAYGARVVGLLDSQVGDVRPGLLLVLGAVGCVLLIACANLSNLLLARASSRRSEIAIRAALGAGRLALVRQLLTESLLLSLAGGLAGLLLASWCLPVLTRLLPDELPRLASISIDVRAIAFMVLLALFAGVTFGLFPALYGLRTDLRESLGSRQHAETGREGSRARSLLVGAEVAVAVVLLVGATLLVRSFVLLQSVQPGFAADALVFADLSLPTSRYSAPQIATFYQQLVSDVASRPGVAAAGAVMIPPLTSVRFGGTFTIEGRPTIVGADEPRAQVRAITPGYFKAMMIGVERGRVFDDRDDEANASVAIVSETAARRFWPSEDPIGKRVKIHVRAAPGTETFRQIVGVVRDVKGAQLDKQAPPVIYVPHAQSPTEWMTLVVRSDQPAGAVVSIVREVVTTMDREIVVNPQPYRERVAKSVAAPRFRSVLLSLFAVIALTLAAIGLYGVVAFSVTRRTHEIGVRMALGAAPGDVVRQMVWHGMRPVLAGFLAGIAGAAALAPIARAMLFGVREYDAISFVVAVAALLLTSVAACYLPARKATRVDPLTTLRSE